MNVSVVEDAMLIADVHAHLDAPEFADDLPQVLARAGAVGLRRILCVGTDLESSRRCVALARSRPDLIRAAVGIHPSSWPTAGPDDMVEVEALAHLDEVVAVGESGLDLHQSRASLEEQVTGLRRHIRLARQVGKPLVIHSRRADEQVVAVLREEAAAPGGCRHCFDRPIQAAQPYLALGFHISVGGAVTRDGYRLFKEAVRLLPADRLLVETDCPYQPPASRAGRRNEPAFILETLDALARLVDRTVETVAEQTAQNAARLLGW